VGEDHGELRDVAAQLQAMLLDSERIEAFLAELACAAAGAVDAARSCGVTVSATARRRMLGATSDGFAARMDAVQYETDDGPCLTCLRSGESVLVEDIPTDPRWPEFSRRGAQEGARQSLSVPLLEHGRAVGAVNLYTQRPDVLGPVDRERAAQFADRAAGALALAVRLAEQEDRARHLEIALRSRAQIDQAVGALMVSLRVDAAEAFDVLRTRSQNSNTPLREVAADVLGRLASRRF
jgi:GAF domain-containing protein